MKVSELVPQGSSVLVLVVVFLNRPRARACARNYSSERSPSMPELPWARLRRTHPISHIGPISRIRGSTHTPSSTSTSVVESVFRPRYQPFPRDDLSNVAGRIPLRDKRIGLRPHRPRKRGNAPRVAPPHADTPTPTQSTAGTPPRSQSGHRASALSPACCRPPRLLTKNPFYR